MRIRSEYTPPTLKKYGGSGCSLAKTVCSRAHHEPAAHPLSSGNAHQPTPKASPISIKRRVGDERRIRSLCVRQAPALETFRLALGVDGGLGLESICSTTTRGDADAFAIGEQQYRACAWRSITGDPAALHRRRQRDMINESATSSWARSCASTTKTQEHPALSTRHRGGACALDPPGGIFARRALPAARLAILRRHRPARSGCRR